MSDEAPHNQEDDQGPAFIAMDKGEDLADFVNRIRAADGLEPAEFD
jgi:hypothetical protein